MDECLDQLIADIFRRMELREDFKKLIGVNYSEAFKLLNDSPEDPIKRPYENKYKARDIFKVMIDNILSQPWENTSYTESQFQEMIVEVYFCLARVDLAVEELTSAEINLAEALKLLEKSPRSPKNVTLAVAVLNQLGLLWSLRDDCEKALKYLQLAENYYLDFLKTEQAPIEFNALHNTQDGNDKPLLDEFHTYTLYYLAQVFKSLNLDKKSALYCHSTLKRQVGEKHCFNQIEWALNAATLSQYLVENFAFKEARHHLAAAEYFLKFEEENLDKLAPDTQEHSNLKEVLERGITVVSSSWGNYCITLLNTSRNRLMGTKSEDHGDPAPVPPEDLIGLYFPTLELKEFENLVPASLVLDMDDAKKVFSFGMKCCNKALELNGLDGYVTDHVNTCLNISQLYELLTFFEENEDSQSKMHKRRKDLIAKVAEALNFQYYPYKCRTLWMELTKICTAMMEIKREKINSTSSLNAKAIAKCNRILQEGIDNAEKFIDSFNDPQTKAPPPRYHVDDEDSVLSAQFLCANLYTKFFCADKVMSLYYHSKSYDIYKTAIDYCERNECSESMKIFLHLAKEMCSLLEARFKEIDLQILARQNAKR